MVKTLLNDSKEVFKYADKASKVARRIMTAPPLKLKYKAVERLFIIYPLIQSENLNNVKIALTAIEKELELVQNAEEENEVLEKSLKEM